MKGYIIKIYGAVQGINFRTTAKRQAEKLNLTGFVHNESDGSVLMEAEGDEGQLALFVAWCQKGPLFAKVEKVEVEETDPKGYNKFEIKP